MATNTTPEPTRFLARGPADVVALVPYLLGFHPADSVVMLTFGPEQFHARADLPRTTTERVDLVEQLVEAARVNAVGQAMVLAYSEIADRADDMLVALGAGLVAEGVCVVDSLRVSSEAYFAVGERGPGSAYDLRTHPITAAMVHSGRCALSDRDELAASVRPRARSELTDRAWAEHEADRHRVAASAAAWHRRLRGATLDLPAEAGWLRLRLRGWLDAETDPSAAEAGRVLVMLGVAEVREVALELQSRANAAGFVRLWRGLLRRAPDEWAGPAAAVLALAAWLSGDGALAWVALDRCGESGPPRPPLAELVTGLLTAAVPPSVWTAVRGSGGADPSNQDAG